MVLICEPGIGVLGNLFRCFEGLNHRGEVISGRQHQLYLIRDIRPTGNIPQALSMDHPPPVIQEGEGEGMGALPYPEQHPAAPGFTGLKPAPLHGAI
jgi:hypothetical protein